MKIETKKQTLHKIERQQDEQKEEKKKETKNEYAFPTKSRCPRCGGTDTRAVSTQNNRQYRECQTPVCRYKYSITGEKI